MYITFLYKVRYTSMRIGLLLTIVVVCITSTAFAQKGKYDTILVSGAVVGNDTIPYAWLPEAKVHAKMPAWVKERRAAYDEEYAKLRYNVYVVYPYAVAAAFTLKDVDSVLNSLYSKVAKKEYKRRKEDELNRKFKEELKNLSIEQGQILVKLIARETGKPCYEIVRDLKGGFNAALFQTAALVFNNNLRNNYDPEGDDAAIESIVQEILSRGHFEMKK